MQSALCSKKKTKKEKREKTKENEERTTYRASHVIGVLVCFVVGRLRCRRSRHARVVPYVARTSGGPNIYIYMINTHGSKTKVKRQGGGGGESVSRGKVLVFQRVS